MKVIAEIDVRPMGVGVSQREEVVEAVRILVEQGLEVRVNALGTEVEGQLEQVFSAVAAIHRVLHESGSERLLTNLRIESRTDHEVDLDEAVSIVERMIEAGDVSRTTVS